MMPELDRAAALRAWNEYVARNPIFAGEDPPSECFGDSPEMADELIDLVLRGVKRASAGAVADFRHEGQPLPRVGDHWIAHDGTGAPRAILRSLELRLGPMDSVDDAFAWDEGEGDRTRRWWLDAHEEFFARFLPTIGVEPSPQVEVVFERFMVVWPPEHADTDPPQRTSNPDAPRG